MSNTPNDEVTSNTPHTVESILQTWVDNVDFQTVPEYDAESLRAFADILDVLQHTASHQAWLRALVYVRDNLMHEFVLEIALTKKDLVEHGIDNRGPDYEGYVKYLLTDAIFLTVEIDKNP